MSDINIARINELAHKAKTPEGLTPTEKIEQSNLRTAYVKSMRSSLSSQLEKVVLVDKDGTQTPLKKK
ncbi:MAG: DUF896 domain-containing protein [Oscillospiraceae bacterium]